MTVKAIVFANRANTITIRIISGGLAQDLASVTRMTLKVGNTLIDSNTNPEAFDWTTGSSEGKVILKLGALLTVPTEGYVTATLTVYDPEYSEGIVWDSCEVPNLLIHVCE